MALHTFNSDEGIYSYAVMHLDGLSKASITASLDFLRDSMLQSAGGKLRSEQPIWYGQNIGRAITADVLKGKASFAGREYVIGDRLYLLAVIYPVGEAPQQAIDRFFSSFKVTEPSRTPQGWWTKHPDIKVGQEVSTFGAMGWGQPISTIGDDVTPFATPIKA